MVAVGKDDVPQGLKVFPRLLAVAHPVAGIAEGRNRILNVDKALVVADDGNVMPAAGTVYQNDYRNVMALGAFRRKRARMRRRMQARQ